MDVVVRDRIYFQGADAEFVERLKAECEHKNSQHFKLKKMNKPAYGEPPVIRTWMEDAGKFSIPRGRLFNSETFERWVDRRLSRPIEVPFVSKLEAFPYQQESVEAGLSMKQGILKLPTGSGKTSIGLMLIAAAKQRSLVLVDANPLGDEWERRAVEELEMVDGSPVARHVGRYGDGKKQIAPLTVATEQSLYAMGRGVFQEFVQNFGLVLADEVQVFGAPTFLRTVDHIPAYYRIGVSADASRPDRKEFLIHDVFGPVIYEKTRAELEAGGFVVGVDVKLFRTEFEAPWYRKATNAGQRNMVRLLGEMVQDDGRTASIVDQISRRAQAGATVLAFSDRVDHCYRVRDLLKGLGVRAGMLTGDDKDERARTIEGMKSGRSKVGIGTLKSIGKGVNIPAADVGVLMTPVKSRQPFGQVRGRLARRGKASAELLVAWDWKVFGDKMVKDLRAWNGGCEILQSDGGIISATEYLRGKRKGIPT